jgi:hypothetical protein
MLSLDPVREARTRKENQKINHHFRPVLGELHASVTFMIADPLFSVS